MKNNKQRLFEVMGKLDSSFKPKLNESGAYNDAGEPLMTHSQYRDYSEPAEPEYDDRGRDDYGGEQTEKYIIKFLEKRFNTILPNVSGQYTFLMKGIDGDFKIGFYNNEVEGTIYINNNGQDIDKNFPPTDIEELDVNSLANFFKPYSQYMLTGQEATRELNSWSLQDAADSRYASQERAAMGGGLGEGLHEIDSEHYDVEGNDGSLDSEHWNENQWEMFAKDKLKQYIEKTSNINLLKSMLETLIDNGSVLDLYREFDIQMYKELNPETQMGANGR